MKTKTLINKILFLKAILNLLKEIHTLPSERSTNVDRIEDVNNVSSIHKNSSYKNKSRNKNNQKYNTGSPFQRLSKHKSKNSSSQSEHILSPTATFFELSHKRRNLDQINQISSSSLASINSCILVGKIIQILLKL